MPIRTRLLLAFSTCLLLACTALSGVVFFHVRKSSEESFRSLALSQLERVEERINTFIEPGIMSIKYLGNLELVRTSRGQLTSYVNTTETTVLHYANHLPHEQRIYDEFIRVGRSNSYYGLLFMANEDGQYAQAPEGHIKYAGYDPRKRSWYREVMENPHEVAFSSPYLTSGGGMVLSIMVKPAIWRKTPWACWAWTTACKASPRIWARGVF